jgi:hypothetical protein
LIYISPVLVCFNKKNLATLVQSGCSPRAIFSGADVMMFCTCFLGRSIARQTFRNSCWSHKTWDGKWGNESVLK